jgi:RNA-directed DNA polymerase
MLLWARAGAKGLGVRLTRSDAELITLFGRLLTFSDLCILLEVSRQQLGFYTHSGQVYKTFDIPKKTGGTRTICAPKNGLNILQKKMNYVLQLVYRPSNAVHGFLPERGILSNAQAHCRTRFILNVDIENFFPTITFPRVRGMLIGKPYCLPPNVATMIARLCCHDGSLPQGAPTSPIVSNMLCARLDAELKRLAREHRCYYTRYADDMTFSTYLRQFPRALASYETTEMGTSLVIGPALSNVIKSNGFEINSKKTRLRKHVERQEVTGLIVNQTPNLSRRYVRQIRAMLHAWRKFDLKMAGEEFFSRYDKKSRFGAPAELFKSVVKGRIDFLGMVKGKQSRTYLALLKQYAALDPLYRLPPELPTWETNLSELRKAVWAIRGTTSEGTAFFLNDVGLVTCAHVIKNNGDLRASHPDNSMREYRVSVTFENEDLDVAVLRFTDGRPLGPAFIASQSPVYDEDQVTLLGYPNFAPGATGIIYRGAVIGRFTRFGRQRIQITCEIAQGNSGGPVLNGDYQVIGIAANGKERLGSKEAVELYGVIPISVLLEIIPDSDESGVARS